jgi:hypothetical protein
MSFLGGIPKFAVIIAIVAMLTVFAVACGGGGDDEPDATDTPEVVETATEAGPTSAPATDSMAIDQDVWHAGWKVSLGTATLETDSIGVRIVSIDAVFENLSTSTSSFNSQIAFVSGGNAYSDTALEHELPRVPGGLTGTGIIAIQVDDDFTLDDATLIIGNPDNNQVTVPIGPDSPDELVTLEPIDIPASGSADAGPIAFSVTGVEVRADLPDWSDEVEAGKLALTVSFEVTPASGIPIGNGVLQSDNVALRVPDGSALAVRTDGRSGVNELLQGREGTLISDLSARFIIDQPAAGTYAFIVRGPYGADRAMVEGEVAFEVPEY